jgi:hypothetical protein
MCLTLSHSFAHPVLPLLLCLFFVAAYQQGPSWSTRIFADFYTAVPMLHAQVQVRVDCLLRRVPNLHEHTPLLTVASVFA